MISLDDLYKKGPVIAVMRNPVDLWKVLSGSDNAAQLGINTSSSDFDLISAIVDDDQDLVTRKLGAAVMQQKSQMIMRYRVEHEGQVRWVEDHCTLVYHPDGSVLCAGSLLWTSTLPLEWHLLCRGSEVWNTLNSKVRHDMLNQLTAILGYLELSQDLITDPMLVDFLGKEQNAAERIREKLIFTREYQKIGHYEYEWIKLSFLITEAAGEAGCSRFPVLIDIPADLKIFADNNFKLSIIRILENIPNHAASATEIKVSFQKKSIGGVLTIEDNGPGIPVEKKQRIFDLGYGSGEGFGLFLAEKMLAIFGIGIIETGTPGTSARFELDIPGEILNFSG